MNEGLKSLCHCSEPAQEVCCSCWKAEAKCEELRLMISPRPTDSFMQVGVGVWVWRWATKERKIFRLPIA